MVKPIKRMVFYVRERGHVKKDSKYYKELLLESYKKTLTSHFITMESIHKVIYDTSKENNEKTFNSNLAHQKIDKLSLIESVSILDFYINLSLEKFQEERLNKRGKNIKSYQKVERGIDRYITKSNINKRFSKRYSIMKKFRKLRNKFSHSNYSDNGGFILISRNEEEFELFLKSLEGIKIADKSFWAQSAQGDGIGVVFYRITSPQFLNIFYKESLGFFKELIEILFLKDYGVSSKK